jgi:hypothetical protein
MNEKIVQQLVKLQVDYEKSWGDFSLKDNDFSVFKHEYQAYYQPLVRDILPVLNKHLNNVKEERISHYYPYIKEEWIDLLTQDIRRTEIVGSQFLNKLSGDLLVDFAHLLKAYQKTGADHLKHHFLHQFFNNKANSIYILIKNNPALGIRTIAKLKSPQLQFALINQNISILEELTHFFSTCSLMEASYLLAEYFDYPDKSAVDKYYRKWVGGKFIHIKFCKLILGDKYESAKNFIKQKNEIN